MKPADKAKLKNDLRAAKGKRVKLHDLLPPKMKAKSKTTIERKNQ